MAFAVNVKAIFLLSKHVIPHMIANGGGSVVNMSSIQALASQVRERMFQDDSGPYSALESCSFHFRLAGFRGGLRFAMGLLLIPTDADWNWVALPRGLRWLYYPLRLIRLAWKYASAHTEPRA